MNDWLRPDWPAPANIVAGTTLRSNTSDQLPLAGTACWLRQVHGADVVAARAYDEAPAADASVKGDSGYVCVIKTADCLPVLICSKDGNAFAAAHAGWRGLASGVIENTITKLGVAGDELLVWLGPAISQASFEVGAEVREAFLAADSQAAACFLVNERGRWQADLYALARRRLNALGVKDIYGGVDCTYLDRERFYSYRRNPDCGRMTSFIGEVTP
jgi:YfiH family protein